MLLFSLETFLLWYVIFSLFLGNKGIEHINEVNIWYLLLVSIIFSAVFTIVIFLINALVINKVIKLINYTREKLNLDYMSLLDKRDQLFNNNRKPVFIVIKDFQDKIINEGELMAYNSSTSDFDLLEIKQQDFKVSDLPDKDDLWNKHLLIDLKQQIKMELYLMNDV